MKIKNSIARFLHRIGISADLLTVAGLLLALFAGWLIFKREIFWASAALLSSGLLDMLDGEVARVSGKAGAFGGIFDSSLDRYGDAFVYGGLIFYFAQLARWDYAVLSFSALAAAFLVSYVRARAECEIDSCRVGFWERGERIGVLVIGLAAGNPAMTVLILGTLVHWTVFQRLSLARLRTSSKAQAMIPFYLREPQRDHPAYFVKVAILIGLLLVVYIP